MADLNDQSVTRLIRDMKAGESEAAGELFKRYFAKLVPLARKELGSASRRVADEEDVAVSVFKSLCLGAAKGRFDVLTDRDDLWRLLLTITHQKSVDHIRRGQRQKRGGGKVRGDSVFFRADDTEAGGGFDQFTNHEPTPEQLVQVREELERLLGMLRNDMLRQVAMYKLEGCTNEEIAERLEMTTRSVERKLRLIREKWTLKGLS
jgi:RNA polymerase sigma factor (sigma-70 family)